MVRLSGSYRIVPARHALVVDDEYAVRFVLRRFLERRGWSIQEAESAEQALQLLDGGATHLDAVIVDLNLPGLSGSALCRRIATLRPELAARLLVASGDASAAMVELARESLDCPVLAKPFELIDLERALDGLLTAA
jgi:two-component system cell cycle sensor histidine kinase/response regulator CckA